MKREIELTAYEIYMAAQVALRRRINGNIRRKASDKIRDQRMDSWDTEIESACSELAVAKLTGKYWSGSVNTFKSPDVGGLQVRHTLHNDGCLIVGSHDADNEWYVLVVGRVPVFSICGKILGREAKKEHHREDDTSWFVPQGALLDVLVDL